MLVLCETFVYPVSKLSCYDIYIKKSLVVDSMQVHVSRVLASLNVQ